MIIKFKSQHYLQLCTSWFLTRMFHFFSFSKMGLASEATLAETVVEVTLLLFSCCGTVLANIMVLIVVATKEKLQAPTYFYYLSLAVSDFILGKEVQGFTFEFLLFSCFSLFVFSLLWPLFYGAQYKRLDLPVIWPANEVYLWICLFFIHYVESFLCFSLSYSVKKVV